MRPHFALLITLAACHQSVDEGVLDALPEALIGVPNLDDDDGDGNRDAWQDDLLDDDDLSSLALPAELVEGVNKRTALNLTLSGSGIRVYHGGAVVMDDETATWRFPPDQEGEAELLVEFTDYHQTGSLTLELLKLKDDSALGSRTVALGSAPFQMNHHLQAAEHLYVMQLNGWDMSNASMIAGLTEVVGEDNLTVIPSGGYQQDVWIQDELEFGHLVGMDTEMNMVLDSIRCSNGDCLDDVPEDYLQGPGTALDTYGRKLYTNSLDSFGNLECSPPVTVDGVSYPFGRIYFGGSPSYHPAEELFGVLVDQRVQAPLQPDSTWLCVGHVDEYMAFLPDPASPKGFRFAITDVDAAYAFLEGLDPESALPKYTSTHGYATVGELLDDQALRALNEDAQADYVDPTVALFKAELGLEESDIIRLPLLFEDAGPWCDHTAIALMPGLVNLAVWNPEGGGTHLLIPDPFFRSDLADQSTDPLIAAFDALMPAGSETHYLDDWDVYHEMMGEVHCGTNIRRAPAGDWWTEAAHLMEVE
ncbi:MAG: hypothetical protein JXX28_14280 [Deltaproteobacteria bacterium]|nr:hypothetical protein [Deltaproteobacteria bacterium]